ncbi:MAG TPA: hypothetical protein PKH09_11540, partial [Parvularculaceae bacterium]|nr:hypothetical protein [Parvularculaceae bacterium]
PGQLIGKTPYLQSVHASAPDSLIGGIAPVRMTAVTPNALAGELAGASEKGRPAQLKVGDAEEARV